MSIIDSTVQELQRDHPTRRRSAKRLWAAGVAAVVAFAVVLAMVFVPRGSDDRYTNVVDKVVAAWNANDMEGLHELYDPAAVVEANGSVYAGIESIHEAAAAFATADKHLQRRGDVTRAGNVVAATFEVTWPEGSGHAHRTHTHITVFQFEDGRVVHEWSH